MCTRVARRSATLAAALVLGGLPAGAQPTGPPLTVAGAMALARDRHPALAAASARRRAEVGLSRQQAALPNPVLEWRQENLASALAPDVFLTVSQPLDLTGRRLALRAESRAVDARAVADSVTVARSVEAAAARAFWRASLARSLADVAAAQRADADRLAGLEAVRAGEGAVSELSAMRAALEAERARVSEAMARAEWRRASGELARAVGVDPDALPVVPPMPPGAPLLAPLPTPDVAAAYMMGRRSDLAALRAGVEAAGHRASAERRAILPDVALQAGTKRTAGLTTRVVGVAMPLPLLDRNAGAREHAAGALAAAGAELHAAELAARTEMVAALESLRALLEARAPGADSLARHAAEVARVADAAYEAGGGSLLDLLDARRARAEALTAALRWAAELRLARLDLNLASGAPLLESLETP